MSTSATWQYLPAWLQEPLLNGHLTLAEASEMWDHQLMATSGFNPLPKHLFPAAERLHLLQLEVSPTAH